MLKNKRKILSIIAIIFAMTMFISYNVFFRTTNVQATSRYGSTGSEVTQIQTKLKKNGIKKYYIPEECAEAVINYLCGGFVAVRTVSDRLLRHANSFFSRPRHIRRDGRRSVRWIFDRRAGSGGSAAVIGRRACSRRRRPCGP